MERRIYGLSLSTFLFATIMFTIFDVTFFNMNVTRFGDTQAHHPGVGIVCYFFYLFSNWIASASMSFYKYQTQMTFINNLLL